METQNFAKKQIARISRNKIIISLIVIAIIGGLMYVNMPPLRNLFVERTEFTAGSELPALLDRKERFVTTTAEYFFDTDYYITSDGKLSGKYYAFATEDSYVVCRVGKSFTGDEFEYYEISGTLKKPSSTDLEVIYSLADELAEAWEIDADEALYYFVPAIIDLTPNVRVIQQIFTAIGAAIIILMLVNIVRAIGCLADYTRAKQFEALSFGGLRDAELTNNEVSRELEAAPIIKQPRFILTRNFAIFPAAFTFAVKRKNDLVWFYKSITQHRTNGIPTGKTYSVTLRFEDGKLFSATSSKKQIDALLAVVAGEFPQALPGYDAKWEKLFNKDRDAFDAVRREYLAGRYSAANATDAE